MQSDTTKRSTTRLPRTFAALRHRNYRLFFAGQLVSLTGTWMQQVALQWLVYSLTKSAFLLGLMGMIGTLPMVFLTIPGGILADRVVKRRILIITQSTAMVLAFILATLTGLHVIKVWQIAVLAACSGTVMAFDMPARQAFVVEMVGREDLMNAIALNSSIFNSARIIGPAVAGQLLARVGAPWCFLANGVSFLAVIAGLLLMQFPGLSRPAPTGRSPLEDVWSGFRYLRSNHTVRRVMTLLAIFSVFGWGYSVLIPLFADKVLHSGARGFGYLVTANGAGALIGALAVASVASSSSRRPLFYVGAVVLAVATGAFSFSQAMWLSCGLLAVAGFGGIVLMSTANATVQLSVSDEMRGRIMGIYALVFAGTTPLSSFLSGATAHYLGAPHTVAIMAAATALVVVGGVATLRRNGSVSAGDRARAD